MNTGDTTFDISPYTALYLIAINEHPSPSTTISNVVKIFVTHTLFLKRRRIHAAQFVQGQK
ncbi:hypothetical protein ACWWJP_23240, partial [Enterobacter hormaechei]